MPQLTCVGHKEAKTANAEHSSPNSEPWQTTCGRCCCRHHKYRNDFARAAAAHPPDSLSQCYALKPEPHRSSNQNAPTETNLPTSPNCSLQAPKLAEVCRTSCTFLREARWSLSCNGKHERSYRLSSAVRRGKSGRLLEGPSRSSGAGHTSATVRYS